MSKFRVSNSNHTLIWIGSRFFYHSRLNCICPVIYTRTIQDGLCDGVQYQSFHVVNVVMDVCGCILYTIHKHYFNLIEPILGNQSYVVGATDSLGRRRVRYSQVSKHSVHARRWCSHGQSYLIRRCSRTNTARWRGHVRGGGLNASLLWC